MTKPFLGLDGYGYVLLTFGVHEQLKEEQNKSFQGGRSYWLNSVNVKFSLRLMRWHRDCVCAEWLFRAD